MGSSPARLLRRLLAAMAGLGLLLAPAAGAKVSARFAYATKPVTFGIYPGGGAGTVGASGRTLAEDPERRLAALQALRPANTPFVLHLYDDFTGRADGAALPSWLADQITQYTSAGFQIELVLRYRPAAPSGDVAGYRDFVRARVRQLGPNSGVTNLQITNEANVLGAPNAADGAYPRSRSALVGGVIAAKREATQRGFRQLKVGFNWAYQQGRSEVAFWRALGRDRDRVAFRRALDWVGLDAYPGTWGPWLASDTLGGGARRTTLAALKLLRGRYLPLARLGREPLHISEAGYPTGPGRSEAMQASVLEAVTTTVATYRTRYGVTDYRWFDLRDADSASQSFESRYGLMRDDYSPKPAFATYRTLVARLG